MDRYCDLFKSKKGKKQMITVVIIECICCSFKAENQEVPIQISILSKWSFSILLGLESVVDSSAHDTRRCSKWDSMI